jgi:hypothetical protein
MYSKNCPECGAQQTYSRRDHYTHAVRLDRVCRACSNKTEGQNSHKGCYKEIAHSWFNKISREAEARGLVFELSIEDIWTMLDEQQHKCKLSGVPIEFIRKANGNTASVDRIDSTIGYLQSNVQLLHRDVNMMKQSFTQSYFLEMCGRISK